MFSLDPGTVAIITGLGTAVIASLGTKLVDSYNGRRKLNIDFANQIRAEQRAEVLSLRAESDTMREQLTEISEKYYAALQMHVELQSQIDDLQSELEDLKGS